MILTTILTTILHLITLCGTLHANHDLEEIGRGQYQLLKEKSNLPLYGPCWTQGVQLLEQGCHSLGESLQSELALHFTNCFLRMSGHETYDCELDKKPNLRAICISNMSDRAFNVYAEFYTHVQNICSFLQGHVWHRLITENTVHVGLKLKETARNQEGLLKAQQESLELQEKVLRHGRILENVLDDLFVSFQTHKDVLGSLFETVSGLQEWIIGEMSWFDSIVFYIVSIVLVFVLTSSQRTSTARLLMFVLLIINFILERIICSVCVYFIEGDSFKMHSSVNKYIWLVRYTFVVLTLVILVYYLVTWCDPFGRQVELLRVIQEQNRAILDILSNRENRSNVDRKSVNNDGFLKGKVQNECNGSNSMKENDRVSSESEKNGSFNGKCRRIYNLRSGSTSRCSSIEP
ncbi:unnamed protein product [Phyllotreta striolata]|uniref:Protein GAMETE EXPRESSED 1 n=1 Tax=Phyllotreta striolata TaxID=444603 RepID=A0A9N9TK32_PHYSR|nr:unnamed protein product [Phyllotreta striolata]